MAFIRSDQYSFIRQGIPAVAMSVGYRARIAGSGDCEEVADGAISRAV